jgi:CheY-like chemotaxis protein
MIEKSNNNQKNEDAKKKVMIIDDDQFLLNMYSLKLKNRGFEVLLENNALEALQKLRDGVSPDVILLDFIMPDMNGLDFLEEVHKANLVPNSKIVALTNQNQPDDIERAQMLGVVKYIVKASTIPSEVVNEVNKVLSESKSKSE